MAISVFDLFSIGIGPSSSHTVGPIRAAARFLAALEARGELAAVDRVRVDLYGSLAATGRAHGTDHAVLLGLEGALPETVETDGIGERVAAIRAAKQLQLGGRHRLSFDEERDVVLNRRETLAGHPNGIVFSTSDEAGSELLVATYYSIGGGFVAEEGELALAGGRLSADLPFPFTTGAELLGHCEAAELAVSEVMLANETCWRSREEVRDGLLRIWAAMEECVQRGLVTEGTLPGFLRVPRRAPGLRRQLESEGDGSDPLSVLDWVDLFALAVSEENAAGGRIVTAPTNGAAGIVPATLHYYTRFIPGASDDGVVGFLLTAGAIGLLCKENASISGAEVGCQGEVGSASAMAAAGLCEVLGGSPRQVENAAEIGIEHNLGLTCDPIGGYVQVPCIERNAMGAVKSVNAARIALRGDGTHVVSLDKVLATMRQTGADMKSKYKETARGGLAVNITEC